MDNLGNRVRAAKKKGNKQDCWGTKLLLMRSRAIKGTEAIIETINSQIFPVNRNFSHIYAINIELKNSHTKVHPIAICI